jgi:hypothetical protein
MFLNRALDIGNKKLKKNKQQMKQIERLKLSKITVIHY